MLKSRLFSYRSVRRCTIFVSSFAIDLHLTYTTELTALYHCRGPALGPITGGFLGEVSSSL